MTVQQLAEVTQTFQIFSRGRCDINKDVSEFKKLLFIVHKCAYLDTLLKLRLPNGQIF